MQREEARAMRLRHTLLTLFFSGPAWGTLFFLMNRGDVNLPSLAMASAGFSVLMSAYMYWTISRRIDAGTTDELLLHHTRTMALTAPPGAVYDALHEWLRRSEDHQIIDASKEFGTLRTKRSRGGLHLGEDVSVHLAPQDGGTAIRIDSHTANPIQRLDDGQNQRNVDAIATMLVESFEVDLTSVPETAVQARERRRPVAEG